MCLYCIRSRSGRHALTVDVDEEDGVLRIEPVRGEGEPGLLELDVAAVGAEPDGGLGREGAEGVDEFFDGHVFISLCLYCTTASAARTGLKGLEDDPGNPACGHHLGEVEPLGEPTVHLGGDELVDVLHLVQGSLSSLLGGEDGGHEVGPGPGVVGGDRVADPGRSHQVDGVAAGGRKGDDETVHDCLLVWILYHTFNRPHGTSPALRCRGTGRSGDHRAESSRGSGHPRRGPPHPWVRPGPPDRRGPGPGPGGPRGS